MTQILGALSVLAERTMLPLTAGGLMLGLVATLGGYDALAWWAWTVPALLVAISACSKLKPGGDDAVIALEGATLIDGAGGEPKRDAVIIIRKCHI